MPLWLLLIPYAVFLLIFLVFSFVDLANAWRFRSGFFSASMLSIIYLSGSLVILYASYSFLSQVDWTQTIGVGSFELPAVL